MDFQIISEATKVVKLLILVFKTIQYPHSTVLSAKAIKKKAVLTISFYPSIVTKFEMLVSLNPKNQHTDMPTLRPQKKREFQNQSGVLGILPP